MRVLVRLAQQGMREDFVVAACERLQLVAQPREVEALLGAIGVVKLVRERSGRVPAARISRSQASSIVPRARAGRAENAAGDSGADSVPAQYLVEVRHAFS
jgi:hypothetical protein